MKRFTDAGRRALKDGNNYAALCLALMLPDICASLEDPGPNKSQARYVRWFRKWVEPKYTSETSDRRVWISAEDCYQLRCSLIHSGSVDIDPNKRKIPHKFEVFDADGTVHLGVFEENVVGGVLQPPIIVLRVDNFSEDMYKSADAWNEAVANNVAVQAEKAKLLMIRSPGAILGGFRF